LLSQDRHLLAAPDSTFSVFYFSLSTFYFACIVANMTASTVAQYLAELPARIARPHSARCAFQLSAFQSFSISEEHMANYQAARALAGKAKKGVKKSAVKKAKTEEVS
jgi:hypothetical protein